MRLILNSCASSRVSVIKQSWAALFGQMLVREAHMMVPPGQSKDRLACVSQGVKMISLRNSSTNLRKRKRLVSKLTMLHLALERLVLSMNPILIVVEGQTLICRSLGPYSSKMSTASCILQHRAATNLKRFLS